MFFTGLAQIHGDRQSLLALRFENVVVVSRLLPIHLAWTVGVAQLRWLQPDSPVRCLHVSVVRVRAVVLVSATADGSTGWRFARESTGLGVVVSLPVETFEVIEGILPGADLVDVFLVGRLVYLVNVVLRLVLAQAVEGGMLLLRLELLIALLMLLAREDTLDVIGETMVVIEDDLRSPALHVAAVFFDVDAAGDRDRRQFVPYDQPIAILRQVHVVKLRQLFLLVLRYRPTILHGGADDVLDLVRPTLGLRGHV